MKIKYAIFIISSLILSISGFAAAQEPMGVFIEMDSSNTSTISISTTDENRGILSKSKINVNAQALLSGSSVQGVAHSKKW